MTWMTLLGAPLCSALIISVLLIAFSCEGNATTEPSFQTSVTGYSYQETGVNLTERKSLRFQAQGADDVLVAIVTTPGDITQNMVEFAFLKTVTILSESSLGLQIMTLSTNGILMNGTQSVWFWISWANDMLTAGSGPVVGNNTFLVYPNMTRIAKATTVAVSSLASSTVEFIVPYNQNQSTAAVIKPNFTDAVKVYDADICSDISFSGPSDVPTVVVLEAVLADRTSIILQFDSYDHFLAANLAADNAPYYVGGFPLRPHMFKSGLQMIENVFTSLPTLSTSAAFYWISWESNRLAVGFGNILGENILLWFDDPGLTNVNNVWVAFNTSLSVSFGYYFGSTSLSRDGDSLMRSMTLKKVGLDACIKTCYLDVVDNPSCRLTVCSNACILNKKCTAFCLHPKPSTGQPCTCELQAMPGTPLSNDLMQPETGASYWLMTN